VNRGGLLMRDNGVCKNSYQLEFFGGEEPKKVATCKPNEVEVPDVVGRSISAARTRLQGQPLTPLVVYKPAKTGDRIGYVVGQEPREGTASAYDKITLISEKSLHGVIPRVTGMPLARAQRKLARLHLNVKVNGDSKGIVIEQSRPAGTASEPGLDITLKVREKRG
jgi:beta-lactam-binding protein with PASTA domain